MSDHRRSPMHRFIGLFDRCTKGSRNGLMSQANAKYWDLATKVPDEVNADASRFWCTRARGNYHGPGGHSCDVIKSHNIVSYDLSVLAKSPEIASKIVGKTIVIVDEQYHLSI